MSRQRAGYTSYRSGKNVFLNARPVQRRPRRFARWAMVTTVLGLLVVGIQNAYSSLADSEFFRMARIKVRGNTLVADADVIAWSQLQVGTNLFACDIASATERIAQQPMVKKALLLREPPETLVIVLEERRPVGMVNAPEGLMGLDASGKIFPLKPSAQVDLPILTGISSHRDADGRWTRALAGFVAELQIRTPAFWREISEIRTDDPRSATVYLVADDLALKMRFENPEQQIRNFRAYTQAASPPGRALAYIDLRYRDQVVVGKRE